MTNKISNDKMTNVKVGIPKEYFAEGLDPKVKEVIKKAIDDFKNAGAEIKEVGLPNTKYALSCYYIIMPVEVASNLARYDGIKFGYSAKAQNLIDVYFKTRAAGFGEEAKRRIMLGTYASSAGYIDEYYNKAQKVRALIKKDFENVFSEVDFVLGPTAPEVAFKIGEKTNNPLKMYLSDIYTIAANLTGLPAISIPVGYTDQKNPTPGVGLNGLPVGLQIIGPQFSDDQIFALGKIYEKTRDGLSSASISQ